MSRGRNPETNRSELNGLALAHETTLASRGRSRCHAGYMSPRIGPECIPIVFVLRGNCGVDTLEAGIASFYVSAIDSHGNGGATEGPLRRTRCVGFVSNLPVFCRWNCHGHQTGFSLVNHFSWPRSQNILRWHLAERLLVAISLNLGGGSYGTLIENCIVHTPKSNRSYGNP